jgi:ABC-type transporter lipoprotein component MlaA
VVLENLIGQFLFNKARGAAGAGLLGLLGGLRHGARRRRQAAGRCHAGRPLGELEPQGLRFNDKLDEAVLKPVAQAYRDVVPSFMRTGINNVLGNLGDVWSAANHLLQGKVQSGMEMGMRVLTNSFFGLGGLLDPASAMSA